MKKKKAKKKKSNAGRPKKITKLVLKKLEEAFALGCSDVEACFFADISHQTLYNYQKKNPEFIERKEALKKQPIFKARKGVVDSLGKDPTGKFDLEFLKSTTDDYNPKKKIEVEDKREDETLNELKKLNKKFDKK